MFADLSVFYYTRSFHALPYLFSCLLYDIYSSARLCSAPVITARAPLEEEWAVVPKCRGKKNAGRQRALREKEREREREGGKEKKQATKRQINRLLSCSLRGNEFPPFSSPPRNRRRITETKIIIRGG